MYSWNVRRQFIYMFSLILFIASVISVIVYVKWPSPSCFDKKQNQGEEGVDCGGPCSFACPKRQADLRLSWVRLIKVSKGMYDVVGQVENGNPKAGIRRFDYLVRVFDKDGILLTTRSGSSFANPNEKFYIYEGGIDIKQREATRALIEVDQNYVWRQLSRKEVSLSVDNQELSIDEQDGTRLSARVTNNSLIDLSNVSFYGLLSDGEKNIVGASMTKLDYLPKGGSARIVFTWPQAYDPAPVFTDVLPRLNFFDIK